MTSKQKKTGEIEFKSFVVVCVCVGERFFTSNAILKVLFLKNKKSNKFQSWESLSVDWVQEIQSQVQNGNENQQ